MITFRYHVVSLVAVLFALAAGVALGGGPLSDLGRTSDAATRAAEQRAAELDRRLDEVRGTAAFQDDVATTAGGQALQGSLGGRPVAVVTMPGADEEVVQGLTEMVGRAGGSVAATYAVQPQLVAPDGKSLVDTLGTQVLENLEDTEIAADAPTYDRMGQLIGLAIATQEDGGAPYHPAGQDVLSSLRGAELMTRSSGDGARASLVLVVLGEEPADDEGADNIYGGLATGIGTRADGIVVTGNTSTAENGVLALLRDQVSFSSNVSSADSVQTAAGRLATVLALGADAQGDPGHYGAFGIDGPLPRG